MEQFVQNAVIRTRKNAFSDINKFISQLSQKYAEVPLFIKPEQIKIELKNELQNHSQDRSLNEMIILMGDRLLEYTDKFTQNLLDPSYHQFIRDKHIIKTIMKFKRNLHKTLNQLSRGVQKLSQSRKKNRYIKPNPVCLFDEFIFESFDDFYKNKRKTVRLSNATQTILKNVYCKLYCFKQHFYKRYFQPFDPEYEANIFDRRMIHNQQKNKQTEEQVDAEQ